MIPAESETGRGVSQGDIIDLKRSDYRDFDVIEYYIRMVAELKQKRF
jgi:triacylglycerol lipase